MREWKSYKIGDICDVIGGSTPSTKDDDNWGGDIPWITPRDLTNHQYRYIGRGERNITLKGLQNSSVRILPRGAVLLSSRAPVGYLAIASNELCTNQGFRSLIPRQGFDNEFIYYLLLANVDYLKSQATGTTFVELSGGVLKSLEFLFPPLPEQRAIAEILGSLDDKIEANRRENETLESTARAIFKSWFVDFDPVHAKARGEQPVGMDAETAALFPDSFEDSALGLIPSGWRVGKIKDLGEIMTGKTPSSIMTDYFDGDIPFIRIPDMHGNVFVLDTERRLSDNGSNSQIKKLLPPFSVCISCIATPGLVSLTAIPSHTNQQINSIICDDKYSPFFVYFIMNNLREEIILRGSGGSATLNLNKNEFSEIEILFPETRSIRSYHKIVSSLFLRILQIQQESRALAETRDALLPRLISGELKPHP